MPRSTSTDSAGGWRALATLKGEATWPDRNAPDRYSGRPLHRTQARVVRDYLD